MGIFLLMRPRAGAEKSQRRSSISNSLLAVILLFGILVITIDTLRDYVSTRKEIIRLAIENLTGIAGNKAELIHLYMGQKKNLVAELATRPTLKHALADFSFVYDQNGLKSAEYRKTDQRYRNYFKRFGQFGEYHDIFLISPDGRVIFSLAHEPDFGTSLISGPYLKSGLSDIFSKTVSNGHTLASGVDYYRPTGAPAIFITAPIFIDDDLAGVVAAQLSSKAIDKLSRDYTGLKSSGEIVLARKAGNEILVIAPLRHISTAAFEKKFKIGAPIANPIQAAVEGTTGSGESIDYRGKRVFAAWQYLPDIDCGMVVKIDADETIAPVMENIQWSLAMGCGFLIILAGISLLVSRSITRPITRLTRATQLIAENELFEKVDIRPRNEIGTLADSFNIMVERLNVSRKRLSVQHMLLEGINEVFRESLARDTVREAGLVCLSVAGKITGSQFGFLGQVNENGRLDTICQSGPGCPECAIPSPDSDLHIGGMWGDVITKSRSLVINTPADHPGPAGILPGYPEITSFMGVPLRHGNQVYGMIALANKPGGYSETDRHNIERLATAIVEAITRKEDQEELRLYKDHLETLIDKRTRQLGESEERFRATFDQAPVGIIQIAQEGRILRVNRMICEITGYTEEEFIGLNFMATSFADVLKPDSENVRKLRSGEINSYFIEKQYTRKDKKQVWINLTVSLMRDTNNAPKYFICIIDDISFKKESEEVLQRVMENLERSNHELEQFAYVASHDLQEPLRIVASYVQLIERRYADKLDQDARDFIHFAVDGANRMKSLINDLLSFSRVETRGRPPEKTDMNEVMGEALVNLSHYLQEHQALVTHDELPAVWADRGQMVQLLQNLISNAVKFRREEIPRVYISAAEVESDWLFSVEDNGIGIEEIYHEQIFVIFKRLHGKKDYPGTGIGLAICKRIVERNGGHIGIDSTPGSGTTFYFSLPQAEGEK